MTMTTGQEVTPAQLLDRVLNEGYGTGAWHGPDLKAALADVTPEIAFRRPADGRHNIAEIALHHAYCIRAVRGQISGTTLEPFVVEGEDWFPLNDEETLSWARVRSAVEDEQRRLMQLVASTNAQGQRSSLTEAERFSLVLGITCHAVYHAGQVQLIKRLIGV